MRHRKRTAKLGRQFEHRNAMLANLVCSLIKHRRVTTTLAKAKAARSVAEKMVTLGKSGTIHHRRLAVARLHQEDAAKILFKDIAPGFKDRNGGYTRIIRLNQTLEQIRIATPFLLRTAVPPIHTVHGKTVRSIRRLGKRIAIGFDDDYWLVLHLMIAGRLHWAEPRAKLVRSRTLAAFDFSN